MITLYPHYKLVFKNKLKGVIMNTFLLYIGTLVIFSPLFLALIAYSN